MFIFMTNMYLMNVRAISIGLDGEYTSYNTELRTQGGKGIVMNQSDNITDLGSLVVETLLEHAKGRVELSTSGSFYQSGESLIRSIVKLHNSKYKTQKRSARSHI
jgi:hypothetical protein